MPIYEYYCSNCEYVFEIMEPFLEDEAKKDCPKCESAAQKMISSPAFHLKGQGWYASDYKNKSGKKDVPPPCASQGDTPVCSGCAHAEAKK
ncbi:MAG: zinc ribbon domain-containing protein [Deferribacteraceae bacterium]|jgi:putative FmdB family regulatory protein|nr:zinc ribbon domain-containing protein [Deferribacteraceae bacterium]